MASAYLIENVKRRILVKMAEAGKPFDLETDVTEGFARQERRAALFFAADRVRLLVALVGRDDEFVRGVTAGLEALWKINREAISATPELKEVGNGNHA